VTKTASPLRRHGLAAAAPLMLLAVSAPAYVQAAASDPAAAKVEAFTDDLLDAMKAGKAAGVEGRAKKLQGPVTSTFDLPAMTRFAVGPKWTTLSAADQDALTKAFTRMTVASWASNFDSWSGQSFKIDPNIVARGTEKLIKTQIVTPKKSPVNLTFRVRQSGSTWKVLDVLYLNGVSELASKRSDFAATIDKGGADALVKKINATADSLLKG
jgi:phospholipid transport system substrate-binding protein